MNILRKLLVTLRKENVMGESLYLYEGTRYIADDYRDNWYITVPPDAEYFADISFYQEGMNFDAYPNRAIILRVGQNVWKDPQFETFYASAKSKSLAVGGYFFFDGRASPQQQADVIIQAMQGKSFEMELFIDWERSYNGPYEGFGNVIKLMQLVQAKVDCKAVGLYTGYYWFVENWNRTGGDYLKSCPLWIAWYANPSVVKVPAPWADWTHWQYGTPAVNWGQPSVEIDANRHNGTQAEFEDRYLTGEIPPPQTGETMKGKVLRTVRIRTAPNTSAGIIGELTAGQIVTSSEQSAGWWKLATVDGVGVIGTQWSAQDYGGVLYIEILPDEPPAGDDEIEILVNGVVAYHIVGKLQ